MDQNASYTDERLVILLKEDNETAFTELYNRYWDKLVFVAANRLGEMDIAEEIMQEIFLNLWNRRKNLALNCKFSTYLAAALKYKIIDTRLKQKRDRMHTAAFGKTIITADNNTQQQLDFEELQDRLSQLVNDLPENSQLVYKLSREAGHSQKEIAAFLNMPEKTVESHLYRTLKQLRISLQQFLSFLA